MRLEQILQLFSFEYSILLLLKLTLLSIPVILYLISKFFKKDEYDDIVDTDDHEAIAVHLYNKLFMDLRSNDINNVPKYCVSNKFLLKFNLNNLFTPLYIYHKFMSKSAKIFEYLFISFEQGGYTRRTLMKFARKNKNYVIFSMEDER
jgi:uncharacterized protein (UPF0333 family)